MAVTTEHRRRTRYAAAVLGAVLLTVLCVRSMQGQAQAATPTPASPDGLSTSPQGTVLDQVVAVVNGDLVLESDVDEEHRFAAFQPFHEQSKLFSREAAVNRLVDRALIMQQAKLQPQPPVTDAEIQAQFAMLRKDIPACKEYDCATDAGWKRFVEAQGFTLPELTERWRERMEVLRFIEMRFKMGIRISPEEIKTYYEKTLLPEYARQKATPPKLDAISDRIQEILLQQQVSALLVDWLSSLKAQGTVRMTKIGEVQP